MFHLLMQRNWQITGDNRDASSKKEKEKNIIMKLSSKKKNKTKKKGSREV